MLIAWATSQTPQERGRDRHRGEEQRHDHAAEGREHEDEHDQRDRDRDRFATGEVVVVQRLRVVVDRREAGDVQPRSGDRAHRVAQRRCAIRCLGVLERGVDLCVGDARGGDEHRAGLAVGQRAGATLSSERDGGGVQLRAGRRLRHQREGAVAALVELVAQQRQAFLGIRAGHAELVREQRAHVARCRNAEDEQHEPGEQHQAAVTKNNLGRATHRRRSYGLARGYQV